jgi:CheY-like chemotaxis protein
VAANEKTGDPCGVPVVEAAISAAEPEAAIRRRPDHQKEDVIALLGHELRNPLAAIRNATELLGRVHRSTPELLRLKSIFERQTVQMAKLIDQLLDLTRVSRGKLEVQRAPVDLVALVRHAVDDRNEQFGGRRLRLLLPDAALWVNADSVRLTQILDNLISNALKFTKDHGSITIAIERSLMRGRLRVEDDGNGIEPALLPHIFDAFRQGDSMRSQGLGLGLSLVRGLCELHGFALTARSDGPGRGASFQIEFPLMTAPNEPPPAPRPYERHLDLLLIEDNQDVADTLAELLRAEGHRVELAESAEHGLDVLCARRPDVVISDIGLPGMDGLELARRIRKEPILSKVKLLALTGFGSATSESQISAAGFERCLTKPVQLDALRRCLSRMVVR